MSWREY